MGLEKGFNDEIKALTAEPIQGVAAGDQYDVVLTTQGKNLDYPLRLSASATPDAFLNLSATQTTLGDTGVRVIPPMNGAGFPSVAATTINMGTGAVAGGLTVNMSGSAFATAFAALTKTDTKFRRFVFALQQDGTVTAAASTEQTTQGALDDYGTLFASIGTGNYIGHIDVVWVSASTKYKTAGTTVVSTNFIENKGIYRPSASGGGGGASAPLVLQSAATPNVTISGGYLPLTDGKELTTWDGGGTATTNYGSTLSFSATAALLASPAAIGGGTSVGASTRYHFYIDLDTLGALQTIASGVYLNRQVYRVVLANIVVGTTNPESVNRSRYVWLGEVTTTSGSAWSGTGATLVPATRMMGANNPQAVSPVAYRLAKTLISAPGTAGQIAAGHILSTKSWPTGMTQASQLAYWNLAANVNDNGPQGLNLTQVGTTAFAGTRPNIFATASAAALLNGTSQAFSQSNAFLRPNPTTTNFSIGGWFNSTKWDGTFNSGAVQWFFSMGSARMISLGIDGGTAQLNLDINAAASHLFVPLSVANNSWHHVVLVSTPSLLTVYFDGKVVGTVTNTATTPATNVWFGSEGGASRWFSGLMEDIFFVNGYAMSDTDVQKLYSYRLDHGAAVATVNQEWSGNVYTDTELVKPLTLKDAIVDVSDPNSTFFDFSDLNGTLDSVELALKDTGLSPTVVTPVPPFDTTYTADPGTGNIAHGQPDIPDVVLLMEDGTTGEWVQLANQGLVTADATNLHLTVSGLNPAVGAAPNRLRVIARPARLASVGVPDATSARTGSVTTQAQTFNGAKTFNGAIDAAGGFTADTAAYATGTVPGLVSTVAQTMAGLKGLTGGAFSVEYVGTNPQVGGASPFQMVSTNNRIQNINPAGSITIKLPTTGILAGEVWTFINRSTNGVSIQSSNGNAVDSILLGNIVLMALVNTPTALADWCVVSVDDTGTWTPSLTILGGGFSSTTITTAQYVRRNKLVSISYKMAGTRSGGGGIANCGFFTLPFTSHDLLNVPAWHGDINISAGTPLMQILAFTASSATATFFTGLDASGNATGGQGNTTGVNTYNGTATYVAL